MWKYLVFNNTWFCVLALFFLHADKSRRMAAYGFLCLGGVYCALVGRLDPFVWAFYFIFSLLLCYSATRFGSWAYARANVLDEDLKIGLRQAETVRHRSEEARGSANALNQKAEEIWRLYDKIKEMSKSLDVFETFLIFGEALAMYFEFDEIKLAVFKSEAQKDQESPKYFAISHQSLSNNFQRDALLKDPARASAKIFPFDQAVLEMVERRRQPFYTLGHDLNDDEEKALGSKHPFFAAYPASLDEKIFAILIIQGIHITNFSILSILAHRFIAELKRAKLYERIEELAITDGLTEVYVRRYLLERFEGEMERVKKFGVRLSFLMIDIDYFKHFNDQYGHLVGDVVLRQVAEVIKKNIRELDLVGRYGGEEFGVLLIDTDASEAFLVAERIRNAMETHTFRAYDENLKVTVSVGCSSHHAALREMNLIIEAADSALYQAKRQGRNKVCVYTNAADSV